MIIIDANVLLYAHNRESMHHHKYLQWIEQALSGTESIGFSWSVIGAFIRISTNHRAFEKPLTMSQALAIVDSWFGSAAAVVVQPGTGHWEIFKSLLDSSQATGNLVPDAHLAALAIEHGASLFSTDHDFRRFLGLKLYDPDITNHGA